MKSSLPGFLEKVKRGLLRFFFYGETKREKVLHFLFVLAMFGKCFEGILEVVVGLASELLKKEKILTIISQALHHEQIYAIKNETVLKWVQSVSRILTSNFRLFISIILTGTGVVKIVLSISLLMRKYIAFPIALIVLIALYFYQISETVYAPSPLLYYLDVFNLIIILIILREFLHIRKQRKMHGKI